MEQTQKKVATKKVAAEKPAAAKPAKASGADKLSKPTRILGYVTFGMLLLGFVVAIIGIAVYSAQEKKELIANADSNVGIAIIVIGAFFAVISQLLGLATGIMLLVKSKKVDADAKIKKANFIMGICAIVGSSILILGGIFYVTGVSALEDVGGAFAIIGLLFATVTILVASIRSSLQFKKNKKPAAAAK